MPDAKSRLYERALEARGYFGYLWLTIKGTTLYSVYGKIASAARKYTFLSRMIKIAVAVISAVKTSAVFLVLFGVLSALIPAMLIHAAVFLVFGAISFRRLDKMTKKIARDVYFFAGENGRVTNATAAALKERGQVMFLTTSLIGCGFSGARARRDGTLLVYVGYYFRMKKLLEENGVKIYFIA